MKIISGRMDRGFEKYQDEFESRAVEVLRSSWYILGKQVESFENEFAEHNRCPYCVGVASGLDALYLGMRALGITSGDEVIVQANTYIASVMGITMNGATPVFVEPDVFYNIDTSKIEERITDRTKAIMVVHLYGQACKMDTVMELAEKYKLYVVEDCAQSHDACFNGQKTGTFGDVGCFSFYPTKNLGGFGDGGAVLTSNNEVADRIKCLRNYGSKVKYHFDEVGVNSRLDELQAGLLRVRLSHLKELTEEREHIASVYDRYINNPKILKPSVRENATSVWHQYVIRCKQRDQLYDFLKENDITSMIHYPIPPHLSDAYKDLGYGVGSFPICEMYAKEVLSLPTYNGMTDDEIHYVIDTINRF